ncbi:MarR family winged helix-turn-helix transcriptional regulator [Kineococcus rubinsiae]|uniref:MarR family winged helix-turn-helix transcriptional regulator n=1 Tax=Kineococcus rubinsiae TaxID=2609562 RepID=UPI0014317F39|nr:MarR family transcriptional regulator [Kineococcus rubinsiae]NIZ91490.1 MarR family transcriptional regulator [Kineococcus rubinsiae]
MPPTPPPDAAAPGDVPGFTADELLTWSGLATLLEWLPAALDAQLGAAAGVTHFEFGVLFALGAADEGSLRMSVLAGHANSSLTRLSRAVTRLEQRGWVRRAPDPGDGRYTLAILTDLGRTEVERATPGHVATVRRLVLEPLTGAQRRQLQGIVQRILTTTGPAGAWRPPGGGAGTSGGAGSSGAAVP